MDLEANAIDGLYQQFWRLEGLYQLKIAYKEIRRYLPSFLSLFKIMKQQKMMGEQDVVDALRFGKELPHLKDQFQLLVEEINSLEHSGENHGGYITIGPDSNPYIVIGEVIDEFETAFQTLIQNYVNSSIADGRAGILRITLDGNPVLDDKGRGVIGDTFPLNLHYAYGIHNEYGMDFGPITGTLWDTEPGHWINDEINVVRPGFNSGYGIIQGVGLYFPAAPFALVNFNGSGKYNDPEFVWTQKVVPTALKFLTSKKLGSQFDTDLFVGAFLDGRLYHFEIDQARSHLSLPSELSSKVLQNWNSTGFKDIVFGTSFGGISSMNIGPDGFLYVVSV